LKHNQRPGGTHRTADTIKKCSNRIINRTGNQRQRRLDKAVGPGEKKRAISRSSDQDINKVQKDIGGKDHALNKLTEPIQNIKEKQNFFKKGLKKMMTIADSLRCTITFQPLSVTMSRTV
jgi:hypothetical protein